MDAGPLYPHGCMHIIATGGKSVCPACTAFESTLQSGLSKFNSRESSIAGQTAYTPSAGRPLVRFAQLVKLLLMLFYIASQAGE